ncbi:hypothetical protein IMX26_00575 [Clostridium sp. 'deep sea']|uniref:hypothetical protein n=1 Tax=Clostridium sp. 'deep sea' TaxID=2779445 RepID=UPI0018967FFD|nr:hypothetical protein [Clostridium sp. 'deep sea']QOR35370.1 hypothetical protein IMX26_00575 [Clostridium sp. 'deep sea']
MPFNFLQCLEQFHKLTLQQQDAIETDNIESLEELNKAKNKVIEQMKQYITPEIKNDKTIQKQVKVVLQKHEETVKLLNEIKTELGKNISLSKKHQTALEGYSKLMQ